MNIVVGRQRHPPMDVMIMASSAMVMKRVIQAM